MKNTKCERCGKNEGREAFDLSLRIFMVICERCGGVEPKRSRPLSDKIGPDSAGLAAEASASSAMNCMTFLDERCWASFRERHALSAPEWLAVRLDYCERDVTKYVLFSSRHLPMPDHCVWRDLTPKKLATQLSLWLSCRYAGDISCSVGPVADALGFPEGLVRK